MDFNISRLVSLVADDRINITKYHSGLHHRSVSNKSNMCFEFSALNLLSEKYAINKSINQSHPL